jgi:hypothetical protein
MIRKQGAIRAWTEAQGQSVIAAFVGVEADDRAPATRVCHSEDEAQRWVETEAQALGLPVVWAPRAS